MNEVAELSPEGHDQIEDRKKTGGRMPWLSALGHLRRWTDLLTVLGLTCVVYVNSLANGFHFHDRYTIIESNAIRHIGDLGTVLSAWPSRPMFTLSLATNYALGGLDPFGYHLLNLFLHLAAVALVYALVKTMVAVPDEDSADRRYCWMPATAAILFALNPVHTQAVNYISARSSLLATGFYLGAVVLFARWSMLDRSRRMRWVPLAGMYICFALGMAGKEIAVTFPAIVLLYDYVFVSNRNLHTLRRRWPVHVPLWLAALVSVLAFRWFASSIHYSPARSVGSNLLSQVEIIVRYIRLMTVPVGLNVHHTVPGSTGIGSVQTLTSFATIVLLLGTGIALLRQHRPAGFAILWFFVALVPTSSVIPLAVLMNENRLYLPGVGFAIVSGYVLTRFLPRHASTWRTALQSVAGIFIILIGVVYGAGTAYRNTVWRSQYTLWTDSVAKGSRSYVSLTNLARACAGKVMYHRALELYRAAAELDPVRPRAYAGMADVHLALGQIDEALDACRQAVETAPDVAEYHHRSSVLFEQKGDIEQARAENARTLELEPAYPEALFMNGRLLIAEGKMDAAAEAFERAAYLRPEVTLYHSYLGRAYTALGDMATDFADKAPWYTKALAAYRRTGRLDPSSADAYYNIGNICKRLGRIPETVAAYETCIRLEPNWPNPYVNLGGMLMELGRVEDAVRHFDRAIELDPSLVQARFNRASAWLELGRVDAAIGELDDLLDRAPEYAVNIHMMLGQAYLAKNESDRARRAFRAALDIQPDFGPARAALDTIDVPQQP